MAAKLISDYGDVPPDQFPVMPSGLYGVLDYLKQAYGNHPVYVHENGQRMRHNGTLNDMPRVEYLHAYIGATLDALRDGANIKGYFSWSFVDCLELLDGYQSSFGFYYVDLDDKDHKRYQKLSARWYANFLKGKTTSNSIIEVANEKFQTLRSQFSQ